MLKRMFLLQEIGIHRIIFPLKRRVVHGRLIAFRDTDGAKFSPDLKLPAGIVVISKATNPEHESYSVFDGTSFAHELRMCEVKRLFVGGLATDYCVVNTVLDARKLGYETVVLMDATLGLTWSLAMWTGRLKQCLRLELNRLQMMIFQMQLTLALRGS